ncbi:MAG: hypothetical protein M1832_005671 [Thelocarpon impressellum]|nr:MAG: hypothetical protein M1832_005671 [Thelocarpon impressellum]
MTTQSSAHVDPLHKQLARSRNLVVAEDPGLHLVWAFERIYVKPMPEYLLSHAFWSLYLGDKEASPLGADRAAVRAAARSGTSHRLIPRGISFPQALDDVDVSPRYAYGQLLLTLLNFWAKIFLRRFTYRKMHGHYSTYLARFYGPLLFVFALFSVAVSAMQVEVTVQTLPDPGAGPWAPFTRASRGFAVFTLISVCLTIAFIGALVAALVLREVSFALRDRAKKRRSGERGGRVTKV